ILDDGQNAISYLIRDGSEWQMTVMRSVMQTRQSSPFPTRTRVPATVTPSASIRPTPEVRPISPTTYYVTTQANLRACAGTSCAILMTLSAAETLTVTGSVSGEAVNGNAIWYRVNYQGRDGFVHSGVVSTTPASSANSSDGTGQGPSAGPTSFSCPSNCEGARAMGLTAEQAARCGLDRDGDGVACYGD
nr:SH3 domain-containing protein [Anaerolineae bacterium]